MTFLQQNIWLEYGFKANPFDTNALTTQVDSFLPISEAIVGRNMGNEESRVLTNILRASGGARIMCEGAIGVGKTTFANYHRYLWENEAKDKLFTPMNEIPVQHHWTTREFLLTILSNLINKILISHGEKVISKDRLLKEILLLTRVFFNSDYQVELQLFGHGAGVSKSSQTNTPFVPETQLLFYMRECIKKIINLGYAGVFLHFDNLELLNKGDVKKTKLLFEDIRDSLQIPNVYYLFVAQRGFFSEIISPLERVRSIFYGMPIYIAPLTREETLQAIEKRYQLLAIHPKRYIKPVEDEFIAYLYELYAGKIRFIMDALSHLVCYYHTGIAQTLGQKHAHNLLYKLAKQRAEYLLSKKELEILEYANERGEFSQKMIAEHFCMKRPNVVSYLNHLVESNCIYRIHDSEGNILYSVNEFFKILKNAGDINLSLTKPINRKKETQFKRSSYNARQEKMLEFIEKEMSITSKNYARIAQVSQNTARSDLKLFQTEGVVKKLGSTRNTEYHYARK